MTPVEAVCRMAKVSSYLEARGVELVRCGRRMKCKCPLPDHKDEKTPSFHIGEFPDGGEYYKCFGCGASGNIVTIINAIEGKRKPDVIRDLAKALSIDGSLDFSDVREPTSDEVVALFCAEESVAMKIATYARRFLRSHGGSEDAVNKVSRLYRRLESMMELGDEDGMERISEEMGNLLIDYAGKE